ncbi:uracil-DNA glycosylase [Litoreibacter arenae]|uniref:Type-4 uracil-DNA glycosylase n=1 Tax=Litoreibacter arenae DSM 19593 TaxID=1123360 RepID=S9QQ76_9RHOB|nr:uracil-DNA glycosylase [Litoreibacter arenae]EPX81783.1 Uracil-DNA glycosylase, family 4 [Litoreibacter arenae DSM 19593]
MESTLDFHTAKALLDWHVDLGADEAIGDAPVNRYEVPKEAPKMAKPAPEQRAAPVVATQGPDPVVAAAELAQGAGDLDALKAAIAAFPHCDLKNGARNLVFSDGIAGARVMVIGEAPGREEDQQGKPFVGPAGQLLDAMFAAIGHGRADEASPIYITNVLPWRPPQNRDPKPDEVAMMMPFLERHIALANPDVLVLMGNHSCQALLGRKGITKMRGHWDEAFGKPALPMLHPAYLLRMPQAKRDAWADLLSLQAKLRG